MWRNGFDSKLVHNLIFHIYTESKYIEIFVRAAGSSDYASAVFFFFSYSSCCSTVIPICQLCNDISSIRWIILISSWCQVGFPPNRVTFAFPQIQRNNLIRTYSEATNDPAAVIRCSSFFIAPDTTFSQSALPFRAISSWTASFCERNSASGVKAPA